MIEKNIQYQVGLKLKPSGAGREIVWCLLAAAGFDMMSLVEEESRRERLLSFYVQDKKDMRDLKAKLRSIPLKGVVLFDKKHCRDIWSTQWKKGWKPFKLTERFYVVPLWQRRRVCPKGKTAIYLDTTNAFGTGLHETTRFTSRIIDDLRGKFLSFLDVGTGTGLLAAVACKSGATRVVGFDIDAGAIAVARQNLKANGLKTVLKVCAACDFKAGKGFDLVAANLVSPDLIEDRDKIVSFVRSGGWLVVSGISLANMSRVKKAFCIPSLTLSRTIKGKEWAAFLFKVQHEVQ